MIDIITVEKIKPTLYYFHLYAPSRSVQLTIDVLGLDVDLKTVSVLNGEQLLPEFLKISKSIWSVSIVRILIMCVWFVILDPHHTIPVYVDDQITITESRAIMMYLVNKYAPNSPIYPTDPVKRGKLFVWVKRKAPTKY